jgi:hypothetical protein
MRPVDSNRHAAFRSFCTVMASLIETERVAETTMVPLHDDPVSLEIVKNSYPASGADYTTIKMVPESPLVVESSIEAVRS